MGKKYFLFFGFLFLLVVAGCETGGDDKVVDVERFRGTSDGVSLAFASGKPLTEFNIGDSVPVEVILRNGGEYDIGVGDAKVKLGGINLATFDLQAGYKPTTGPLRGLSQLASDPGEQRISFGNMKYKGEILSGSSSFRINANVCYPYQTNVETSICVSSSSFVETGGESVCSVEGEKIQSGDVSSAPVQVTSLTEKHFGSDKIKITMEVKNVGTGNVYSPTTECDNLGDEGIVNIDIFPNDVQCFDFISGEPNDHGQIRLVNGAKMLDCRRTVAIGDNYEDKLLIKLNYIYTDSVSKDFTVFNV